MAEEGVNPSGGGPSGGSGSGVAAGVAGVVGVTTPSGVTSAPSGVASAGDVSGSFQSGQSSASITSTGSAGTTAYASEQGYKLTITNGLNKKMVLSGTLKEDNITIENEENAIKRLKEELLLQGEVDGAALEEELKILKLLENVDILQAHKRKMFYLFSEPLTGAAIAPPLKPTGEHINANLLKDLLLNAEELQNLEVNPGETLEKEIKIRRGLSLYNKQPPKIVFSSGGEQVLVKDISNHEEIITGTAVDVDSITKKFDFYIIIPPQQGGGKETFTVEMNINTQKIRSASQLPLKIKLPFFLYSDSENIFTELYGPYTVNLEKGALIAAQYDSSALPSAYQVVGKVYKKGTELIAENKFDINGD